MTHLVPQLIETMRAEPDRVIPLLAWHRQRLQQSCAALGYDFPDDSLWKDLEHHLAGLDPRDSHRVRLLLGPDEKYVIESGIQPATPTPVSLHLCAAPLQADPFWLRHKTTHRQWFAPAQAWLEQNPAYFDVVFCNARGEVSEGSRSNVYVKDASGTWLTPPLSSGLLPGVQRQFLLDRGQVVEACITRQELIEAKAIRVSNALRGWLDAEISRPLP